MTTRKKWDGTAEHARVLNAQSHCADCGALLPGPYGAPGVSLARTRPQVLLCSRCGTAEALADYAKQLASTKP